ncbi:MAG: isochorismate synthase [Pseudomonadota bacterium]
MLAIAFDAHRLIAQLDTRLDSVLRHTKEADHKGMLSVTLAVPELASLELTELPRGGIYWARLEDQSFRFAMGQEALIQASGRTRFQQLEEEFSRLCQSWVKLDPDNLSAPARAFVGFSFSPKAKLHSCWQGFANACILVPSLLLERKGHSCQLTFTCNTLTGPDRDEIRRGWLRQALNLFVEVTGFSMPYDSLKPLDRIEDTPSESEWLARVHKVLKAIEEGHLEKVVLTRRVRVRSHQPLRPARSLSWLSSRHSSGVQLAYASAHATLVGASPERLVSLQGDKVICDAVAGTACRHPLADQDRKLGLALLADNKARHEQDLVVNSIIQSLDPLCTSLSAPVEPQLLKSSKIQHLWSPIHGRVRSEISLLDLASKLHPTPAVGGTPCQQAVTWLEEHESGQRGWYTGALGWMATDGSGELAVILRCALLRHNVADLFAGAGIVGDSNPEDELAETEWKLRTMLDALAVV